MPTGYLFLQRCRKLNPYLEQVWSSFLDSPCEVTVSAGVGR
ncbi:hypothetical protein E2C01_065657 [Portunus trituberculatus]|uniref:Uncharacterized protein n=1 Tax=Portunus trituberculatus TaxID=210409 RepID=A0A5B7HG59_PORTR|nr:hypothetical protein [Portunus trituberculatus]